MSLPAEAQHYDRVTEPWMRWVMGDDLHFGDFTDTKDLSEASRALTTRMIDGLDLQPSSGSLASRISNTLDKLPCRPASTM